MPHSIRFDLTQGSECLQFVRDRISRKTLRRRGVDDSLEPFSEVWAGLKDKFLQGQILEGKEVGRLLTIIDRRVSNYFKSQGAKPIEQPSPSDIDAADIDNIHSAIDPPYQMAIEQEQLRLIIEKLSEMPPHWAEAVRSRFGFPGALEWTELVRRSGTKRQNVAKRLKKGLEVLKPLIASFFPESICVRRANPES